MGAHMRGPLFGASTGRSHRGHVSFDMPQFACGVGAFEIDNVLAMSWWLRSPRCASADELEPYRGHSGTVSRP
jgi:hypothetical protein